MIRAQMRTTVACALFVMVAIAQPGGKSSSTTSLVLDFDDLPYNTSMSQSFYGGFAWTMWDLYSDVDYLSGTNTIGSPSGLQAVISGSRGSYIERLIEDPPGSCCKRERFDFIGAKFATYHLQNDEPYLNSAREIRIDGYRDGVIVATQTISLDMSPGADYAYYELDFYDIDGLAMRGGATAFSFGAAYFMDDFTYLAPSAGPPPPDPGAEIEIALESLQELTAAVITTGGNQNALTQFLRNAALALAAGDTDEARDQLTQAARRTDGCALRGTPDGNGPGKDWITTCAAQAPIYEAIAAALAALSP